MRVELEISEISANITHQFNPNTLIPAIQIGMPVLTSSCYSPSYDHSRIRIDFDGNREGGNY